MKKAEPGMIGRLRAALRPFATFAEKWEANPIKGLADEVYAIHSGEEGAVLRLSDCQAAAGLLREAPGLDAPELTGEQAREMLDKVLLHMPYRAGARTMLGDLARSKTSDRNPYVKALFEALCAELDGRLAAAGEPAPCGPERHAVLAKASPWRSCPYCGEPLRRST